MVVEENKTYADVLGAKTAPYLNGLARDYGSFAALDAGFPPPCPSLAAYLILTSGDGHGICDDKAPAAHPIDGPSIFSQLSGAGREWRVYGESMPTPCAAVDSPDRRYAVRHTAAPYYTAIRAECAKWAIPMGTPAAGAFHHDLTAGALPPFSLAIPDVCGDMHGGQSCQGDEVGTGDDWLRRFLPAVMAGPDYTAGRLVVIITWDEGSTTDNHIATLVISPTTRRATVTQPVTLCAVARLTSRIVDVPPLGCAASAPDLVAAFGLGPHPAT